MLARPPARPSTNYYSSHAPPSTFRPSGALTLHEPELATRAFRNFPSPGAHLFRNHPDPDPPLFFSLLLSKLGGRDPRPQQRRTSLAGHLRHRRGGGSRVRRRRATYSRTQRSDQLSARARRSTSSICPPRPSGCARPRQRTRRTSRSGRIQRRGRRVSSRAHDEETDASGGSAVAVAHAGRARRIRGLRLGRAPARIHRQRWHVVRRRRRKHRPETISPRS